MNTLSFRLEQTQEDKLETKNKNKLRSSNHWNHHNLTYSIRIFQ